MIRKRKEPTATSIVEAALATLDDFATCRQLQEVTGLDSNHVTASLHCFKRYHAAECLESAGQLWWYLTPLTDQRQKKVAERTPEAKPRKQRNRKEKQA